VNEIKDSVASKIERERERETVGEYGRGGYEWMRTGIEIKRIRYSRKGKEKRREEKLL
jgi:hypothetical protein